MAAPDAAVAQTFWLDDANQFLDELRRDGFAIGLDDEIRFVTLLKRLIDQRVDLEDPRTAAGWLGPVICTNPREQARFRAQLVQWAERHRAVDPGAPAGADGPREETDRLVEQESRRVRAAPWALGGVAVLLTLASVWLYSAPPVPETSSIERAAVEQAVGEELEPWVLILELLKQLLPAAIPVGLAGAFLAWSRGRRMALARAFTIRDPTREELPFTADAPQLFAEGEVRRDLLALGRHLEVPSREIAVRATIRATVSAAGRPELRYGTRRQLPSYLLLVDCRSKRDHMLVLADELQERMRDAQLEDVRRFDFYGDPRRAVARGAGDAGRVVELVDLVALGGTYRLLLLTDGEDLFTPLSGRPQPWLSLLQTLPLVAILTPTPPAAWGPRERELEAHGFALVPLTQNGIRALAEHVGGGGDAGLPWQGGPSPPTLPDLAARLRQRPAQWLADTPPAPEEVEALVAELRVWLGADAYDLLCAVAVYPEIHPQLTRHLGTKLKDQAGGPLLTEARLGAIARLPWLREGRMPDWLRRALVTSLTAAREEEIRDVLDLLLLQPKTAGNLHLEFVPEVRSGLKALWDQISRRPPGRLRDAVFLGFMRGRQPDSLEVQAGSGLVQSLRRHLTDAEWAALCMGLAGALVTVWFAGEIIRTVEEIALELRLFLIDVFVPVALQFLTTVLELLTLLSLLGALALWAHLACGSPPATTRSLLVVRRLGLLMAGGLAAAVGTQLAFVAACVIFLFTTLVPPRPALAADPPEPPIVMLFAGDRWWLTLLVLLYPLVILFTAEAAQVTALSDPNVASLETRPGPLLELSLWLLFAALFLGALAKPRLRLRWRDVLVLACALPAGQLVLFGLAQVFWRLAPAGLDAGIELRTAAEVEVALGLALGCMFLVAALWRRRLVPLEAGWAVVASATGLHLTSRFWFAGYLPIAEGVLLVVLVVATGRVDPRYRRAALAALGYFGLAAVIGYVGRDLSGASLPLVWSVDLPMQLEASSGVINALQAALLWPALRYALPKFHTRRPGPLYEWDVHGSRRAWLLVPVIWLLIGAGIDFGPWSFELSPLILPVAAWLGAQHGRTGLRVLAWSAPPFLISVWFGGISTAGNPGLFMAAVVLCRLFGQSSYREHCLRANVLTGRNLAFLLVVLASDPNWYGAFGAFDVALALQADHLFFLLLFLIGLSRIHQSSRSLIAHVLVIVGIPAGLGLLAEILGLFPRVAGFQLAYVLDDPRDVTTGVILGLCGIAVRLWLDRGRDWPASDAPPWLQLEPASVSGIAVLAGAVMLLGSLSMDVDARRLHDALGATSLHLTSALASAVLLFLLGLVGGRRGMLLAGGVWAAAHLLIPGLVAATPGAFAALRELSPLPGIEVRLLAPPAFVQAGVGIAEGWFIGPFDLLFAPFGWRVRAALLRPAGRAPHTGLPTPELEEAAAWFGPEGTFEPPGARRPPRWPAAPGLAEETEPLWPSAPAFGLAEFAADYEVPLTLPPLNFRFMDKVWAWVLGSLLALSLAGGAVALLDRLP